jgi:hypothetical protein
MRTQSQQRVGILALIAAAMAVALLLAAGSARAAAPSIDVSIEPSQIALGESARLTILTSGNGTLSVSLPVVAGLEFRVVGQSRQIEMINGTTIESTSTIVRVTPDEAGVFTIPGLTPKSPPLVLRVTPTNGGGPSLQPDKSEKPGLNPLTQGGSVASGIRLSPDGSTYVRLEVSKHDVYVGENVPAEIQVGMRDGFASSINGLPKLNSDDFTLNNLTRQPEHNLKIIDGKQFTVYSWRTVLAAVKPGKFSLTFEVPATVRIRTQPRRDSMLDDLLGDPFLQNIFGSSVQKNITVTSPEIPFTVLALPTENKPPDFSGAVGNFKIATDISSPTAAAGDPLTLRLHVNGAGNFDRVDSNMLAANSEWKTYDPKSTFKAGDPIAFHGEKIFEQPVIAAHAGTQTIPALSFSYFDPDTHHYETAHSTPLTVKVSPASDVASNEPPPASGASGPGAVAGAANGDHSGLRPDHAASPSRVASLMPLYFQPRFLALSSTIAVAVAGAWLALRRREREANDIQGQLARARAQTIHVRLAQMAAASTSRDTAEFFSAAHALLQQIFGARWRIPPEHISMTDIDANLEGDDLNDIRQIFTLADEANYSGDELKAADYERWTQIIRRQLPAERTS